MTERVGRTGKRWVTIGAALVTAAALAWPVAAQPREVPIEVGQAAPDFELSASDGKVYRLGDMEDRKARVLIFFRGTW